GPGRVGPSRRAPGRADPRASGAPGPGATGAKATAIPGRFVRLRRPVAGARASVRGGPQADGGLGVRARAQAGWTHPGRDTEPVLPRGLSRQQAAVRPLVAAAPGA